MRERELDNPLRTGFRVGDWDVLPLDGQITGPGGSIHLEPKVMDVLVCLASNAGNVTERNTLLAEVWGNTAVSDEPLTRCIAALRKSLGDDPNKPRYIQTVPKRGYRLVADVQVSQEARANDEPGPRAGRRVPLYAILVLALALAVVAVYRGFIPTSDERSSTSVDRPVAANSDVSSVVVLPFNLVGGDGGMSNLGRTISADIVTLLSKVDGLRTKSLLYVDSLVEKGMSPIEICNELDASHLLQGSVETEQDTIKLTLELINAENGDVTWSESLDDDISGLVRLQYSVVDNVAVNVGFAPLVYSHEAVGDVDPRAYRLYVKANGITDPTRSSEVVEALAQAVQYDPDFAAAHSMLARQYMTRGWASEDRFGPYMESAIQHANIALELDPDLVEPRLILANIHALRYQWVAARDALDAVTGSSPDALPAAPIVINFGKVRQAIELSVQMHADNPLGAGLTLQTVYFSIAGEFDRALQAAEIARNSGQLADISRLGVYHARQGDLETATDMFALFLPAWGFDPSLAQPYAESIAAGQVTSDFQAALDGADKALEANSLFFHIYIGSPADTVFELADRLYRERRLNIIAFYEPWAVEYRADPRFLDLVDTIGLLEYWRTYGPPDFCTFDDDRLICS